MINLNELYENAEKENIKVEKFDLGDDLNWKGQCLLDESNNCLICLNKNIKNEIIEKCTLAHELGHFYKRIFNYTIFSNNYNDTLISSINEFRAKKWAVNKLIPLSVFKSFLGTNLSKFDIAEKLNVTEELLDDACKVYEPYLIDNDYIKE